MTGRERVLAVLKRESPDVTPVDVGAIETSGVTAAGYGALKSALGISGGHTRVSDPVACIVRVEKAFREKLKVDGAGLFSEPRKWRPAKLPDGSDCLVPEKWESTEEDEGAHVFKHAIADLECRRECGECGFRYVGAPLAECDSTDEVAKKLQSIAFYDWPYHADEIAAEFGSRARAKRIETDCALVLNVRTRIAGGAWCLRGADRMREDLASRRDIAQAILGRLADACIARLTDVLPDVADHADAVCVAEGPCPGLTLDDYRSFIRPHHDRIFSFVRTTTGLPVIASVRGLTPDIIKEMLGLGIDAVAPAAGDGSPSAVDIRKACGPDVPLWGVGVDSAILTRGTPDEARSAVRTALEALGGNCVFAFGSLLRPETPAENLIAALEAARGFRG